MAIIGSKRALLGAAAVAAASALAFPASGQEAVIRACQALPTEAERFECLADALRMASGQGTMSAEDVAAAAAAAPQPAPTAPAAAAPVVAASAAASAPAAAAVAATEERRGFRIPFVGRGRDEAGAGTVGSDSAVAREFGAELVDNPAREAERAAEAQTRVVAAVVDMEIVGYQRLQVELDNGQVWRAAQAEDPWDPILDDDPERVELFESRFGGYRMRINDSNRVLMVERVR